MPKIYSRKTELLKGPFYDGWSYFGRSHFSDRNPDTHRRNRQTVAGAYSLNYLTSLERYCDSCTELLIARLDKVAESGAVIDITRAIERQSYTYITLFPSHPQMFYPEYSYDCVSEIGFGKRLGVLL